MRPQIPRRRSGRLGVFKRNSQCIAAGLVAYEVDKFFVNSMISAAIAEE